MTKVLCIVYSFLVCPETNCLFVALSLLVGFMLSDIFLMLLIAFDNCLLLYAQVLLQTCAVGCPSFVPAHSKSHCVIFL